MGILLPPRRARCRPHEIIMGLLTIPVGQLRTNCYLIYDNFSRNSIIIDPGDDGDFLSEKLQSLGLSLKYILLTHGHFDHVLGILALKLNFNPKILINHKDLFLYEGAPSSSLRWINQQADPLPSPDLFIQEGEEVKAGNITLKVIETPGHTPGSVCFYQKKNNRLFTGDLLFKNAVGRTDFSYASPSDLQASLKKISKLPKSTTIHPGHGAPSTLKLT